MDETYKKPIVFGFLEYAGAETKAMKRMINEDIFIPTVPNDSPMFLSL